MAEFIGSRISLVSKSDIRYVGTLHEINSETSTVALENVSSFGTEGRKSNPDEEIPPSDSVYEYIVFRGSDVKDLRIEEAPAAKENKPPQVPNDPAILGSGSRPAPQAQPQRQQHATPQGSTQGPSQGPQGFQQGPFGQHPQYPGFYPPPPGQGWGRGGPPGPHGFPPMPYGGGPPGWYPGPQQGFPPGPFPPYGGFPPGPPGQFQGPPQNQASKPAPIGPGANKQANPPSAQQPEKQVEKPNEKPVEPKSLVKPAEMPAGVVEKPATPVTATSSSPNEGKASTTQSSTAPVPTNTTQPKSAPTGPKTTNRIQPVVPLSSPAATKAPLQSLAPNAPSPSTISKPSDPSPSLRDATQAATAAVAAAMAKLPAVGQANGNAVDNLQRKVNEMRVNDPIRAPRQPGGTNFGTGRSNRGGRGGSRGGAQKVDVPKTDFDFESANAKFNKQDLVKEAIAGSPLGETASAVSEEAEAPASVYNKATSFFDNISSEAKERAEAGSNSRPGGREWRGEEQKKNLETFGQGSVDNGYRGGYRGRGRGRGGYRGRGYSGNGQPARGRGGYRGRGDAQAVVQ